MMNKLVVTTLESKFHVFDLRTFHPSKGYASLVEKVCICIGSSELIVYISGALLLGVSPLAYLLLVTLVHSDFLLSAT